jgi:sucrose-6-phosphate hydrolase SacC (GH32 family)
MTMLPCAGDADLEQWSKQDVPFLPLPPPDLPLTGWRDPFVIQRGENGKDWIILMGAGLKDQGGTTLIYRSKGLGTPWEYDGLLCLGDPSQGAMWECPLLWRIAAAPDPDPGDIDSAHVLAGHLRHTLSMSRELDFGGGLERELVSAFAITGGSDIFAGTASELQVREPACLLSACLRCRCVHAAWACCRPNFNGCRRVTSA